MYIFPEMIDLGLPDDGSLEFPSEDHRAVAQALALGNPNVTTRDQLAFIVREVCNIPVEKIRTVCPRDLSTELQSYIG